jgi:hypothetical protein
MLKYHSCICRFAIIDLSYQAKHHNMNYYYINMALQYMVAHNTHI